MARAKVEGIMALRRRMESLGAVADSRSRAQAANEAQDVMNNAAKFGRDAIRVAAATGGWPNRLIETIFKFGDIAKGDLPRSLRASLVGIRKGAPPRKDPTIYKEWKARGENVSPRKKRGAGELIGMSLATMYEFGTTKMAARPAFRDTYKAIRPIIRLRLIEGYKRIIEGFNR